jgi:hexosaminidase
MDLVPP